MKQRLFVYGTLVPGRSNAHELEGVDGAWEPATVRGRLLPNGWGAAAGYPAVILDDDAPEVHGMLLSSDQLREHWERLDDFEGDGYSRVLTSVRLAGGERAGEHVPAFVYVLRE